jgi:hypothetical protein
MPSISLLVKVTSTPLLFVTPEAVETFVAEESRTFSSVERQFAPLQTTTAAEAGVADIAARASPVAKMIFFM